MGDLGRSPTFLVGSQKQRGILDEYQKREQHFSEEYQKNKALCYSGRAFQKTHPLKLRNGVKDADATLASPMLLGVCDGVSQLEEYGMDASLLPQELISVLEELAMTQLMPDGPVSPQDKYRGPVSLLKEAYEATENLGSTTVLLAALDNSTRIHGKLHPMIAVLSIGDCELLLMRRAEGRQSPLKAVFHTEMQRIDGHAQTPLQLARVDERIDEDFDEAIAIEVIERGSAVHCVSAYEGDIVIMGSDGVFDNLFLDEVVMMCNEALPPKSGSFSPTVPGILGDLAQRLVYESHAKTENGQETPIGRGGKIDDTSVVVAEIIEWTQAHSEIWQQVRRNRRWDNLVNCGGIQCIPKNVGCRTCNSADDDYEEDHSMVNRHAGSGAKAVPGSGAWSTGSHYETDCEEEDDKCVIL